MGNNYQRKLEHKEKACLKKLHKEQKGELTNDEIKTIVESVSGCQLIYVKRNFLKAIGKLEKPQTAKRGRKPLAEGGHQEVAAT